MTHYNGFDIDSAFRIFKDGKECFTAWWQNCDTMDEAKRMIDQSNETKRRQLECRPSLSNYSPMMLLDHDEQQERDRQDFEDKVNDYFEKDMI